MGMEHKQSGHRERGPQIGNNRRVAYQVKAGYARIISWEELQRLRPKNLKESPLAVVRQRDQIGRMILDLSFAVRRGKSGQGRKRSHLDDFVLQPSVNDTTERLAPEAPVKELGNVLPRLLNFSWLVYLLKSTSTSQRWI
jgi:hypothetical protein